MTTIQDAAQLDEIIKYHREIFEQLKLTGAKIQITMMVGNHDYDLACDDFYVEKLPEYNIKLDTSLAVASASVSDCCRAFIIRPFDSIISRFTPKPNKSPLNTSN